MKKDHEERIFHLTGLEPDRETAVLRVFGSIRGSIPELSRQSALKAVYEGDGRYAKFPLAPDRHTIELNLGSLGDPEESGESYWRVGTTQIRKLAERISSFVHDKEVRHLSVFAFARIPFLILLGFELDDKVPIELYQKHRGDAEGWVWPEDGQPVGFEWELVREGTSDSKITLLMSLSGRVSLDDVPLHLSDTSVFEMRPINTTPNPNLFRSRATLDAFARCYQDFLSFLEDERSKTRSIHLMPAVPITAAIATGRHLMRHVQPEVVVYERLGAQFEPVIAINQE
ncbi:MAG: SAVED domain-containing protein [Armatimonadetes bacterium]|nr:SAVED domain-containing protein [Armatimonadota bacterium]